MRPQHVNPEEAVQMHVDLKSKYSLGIHWGTFILTTEPEDEPPKRLSQALQDQSIPPQAFVTSNIGEVKRVTL